MTDLHTAIRGALPANSGSGDIMWEDWADGIIAAIAPLVVPRESLEQVDYWCPVHGTALCPENYMLMSDGATAPGYHGVWDESLRCGRRSSTPRRSTATRRLVSEVASSNLNA